jgi:Fe-S oxidoreductase
MITTMSVTFDVAHHIISRRPRDFCCGVIGGTHVEFPELPSIAILSAFRRNQVSKVLHIFQHG